MKKYINQKNHILGQKLIKDYQDGLKKNGEIKMEKQVIIKKGIYIVQQKKYQKKHQKYLKNYQKKILKNRKKKNTKMVE